MEPRTLAPTAVVLPAQRREGNKYVKIIDAQSRCVVPVPLDPGEKDVTVSLRDCLERAFAEGRYAEQIDYSTPPPPPPLDEATAEWVRQIAAGAGKT